MAEKIICPTCGAELDEGTTVCPYCRVSFVVEDKQEVLEEVEEILDEGMPEAEEVLAEDAEEVVEEVVEEVEEVLAEDAEEVEEAMEELEQSEEEAEELREEALELDESDELGDDLGLGEGFDDLESEFAEMEFEDMEAVSISSEDDKKYASGFPDWDLLPPQ